MTQSILGTFDEMRLPAQATVSLEVDVLPIADDSAENAHLARPRRGVTGGFSSFKDLHVDAIAARLPTETKRHREAAYRAVDWIASWDAGPPRTAD